jgi:hypothetical protein
VPDESELIKNLSNRWEEFDGDLKNLRGRFPMAVIGAMVLVPATVLGSPSRRPTVAAFVDMLNKLTAPGREWVNAYDAACLVIGDFEHASASEVPILNPGIPEAILPDGLQPDQFFDSLLSKLFTRAPVSEHEEARAAALQAKGESADLLRAAAAAERAMANSAELGADEAQETSPSAAS